MSLGKTIKKIRESKGLSQEDLSALTNNVVSQGAISALEKRDSTSSKHALLIAKALNVPLKMLYESVEIQLKDIEPIENPLAYSRGQKNTLSEYDMQKNNTLSRCPVISWIQAGKLCDTDEVLDYETAEEWRYCPVKHSEKTYVLIVDGDSMTPEYPDKTEIFIDPLINAKHNDDVVVSTPNGKATFKRLQVTNEGMHLLALNPNWPNRIIEVPEGTTICGVVIYSGRKRR